MVELTLPGIVEQIVRTPRLAAGVLRRPAEDPVHRILFIHGNVSSAAFWQPVMLALPVDVDAFAVDLRGFGASEPLPVDARRGVRDFSDDVASVIDGLGLGPVHVVGWSMGGGVAMQLLIDRPELVRSLTLESTVSPYGFGGTATRGEPCTADGAGTGGGGANPDFVARLAAGDRTEDAATSPLAVFRSSYVAPGYESGDEPIWLEAMLTTVTGVDNYPGDSVPSENWPGFAAGSRGVLNTMAPTHFDTTAIVAVEPKPPVLWIRGTADAIVNDASFFDLNQLGKAGIIEGWPGEDEAPPQPMLAQTRAILDEYATRGGSVTEVALPGCGHSPHLERPDEFLGALRLLLGAADDARESS
ncbi:pimeloyl-ACP methyl ester carboxylesterase [Microbacterium resistens]|uniref:Pimeloyl-ACP methyl ester carboxylesterase n=1 Tax=Microbacterium resistens TaxID=156977 RepID=A0ABU1S9G0_9MICO|nr:alpha/beta hydrolase [Microbacterium resistens]MDR6865908.1 pimeloyl-ACP methyl ester carboxylesterase [Microbacterium resistens]